MTVLHLGRLTARELQAVFRAAGWELRLRSTRDNSTASITTLCGWVEVDGENDLDAISRAIDQACKLRLIPTGRKIFS